MQSTLTYSILFCSTLFSPAFQKRLTRPNTSILQPTSEGPLRILKPYFSRPRGHKLYSSSQQSQVLTGRTPSPRGKVRLQSRYATESCGTVCSAWEQCRYSCMAGMRTSSGCPGDSSGKPSWAGPCCQITGVALFVKGGDRSDHRERGFCSLWRRCFPASPLPRSNLLPTLAKWTLRALKKHQSTHTR